MPYEISYHPEEDYVVSTFTGAITMTLVRAYLKELIPILEKTGTTRLLSDSTDAQVQLSTMDILQFPKMAAAHPQTARLKRAALAPKGSSGYEMYETLSRIQGQHLRVFTDRAEALAWLLADEG